MSRVFVAGSSTSLGPLTAIVTGLRTVPLTIGATVSLNNITDTSSTIACVYDSSQPFNWHRLLGWRTGSKPNPFTYHFAAQSQSSFLSKGTAESTAAGPLPATWYRIIGRFIANNSRDIWAFGQVTNAINVSVGSCDYLTIGSRGSNNYYNASIGGVAYWSSGLSDQEVSAWLGGAPAEGISPSTLVYHFPIWGFHSPEAETVRGSTIAVVNSPSRGPTHPFTTAVLPFGNIINPSAPAQPGIVYRGMINAA